ncbi:MAG: CRISPR-associated endonuclease Cas2 [Thermoplasmata archaeon]|nr:MAG: CRISPR-associated endonuclease Cas2 [Thermoplasmata archaeon]
MYVIVVYDVAVERVAKVCQFLRMYLNWIQNSVFEGELTQSQFLEVKNGIGEIINQNEDTVRFYVLRSKDLVKIDTIGIEKSDTSTII